MTRNFHGGFFVDGDELNKLFRYRQENVNDYWGKIKKAHPALSLAKIVPTGLIKQFGIKRNFKDNDAPAYWYKHGDVARLTAFFGSKEAYEAMPKSWDDFPLWDYKKTSDMSAYKPVNYGFDIDKSDKDVTIDDLKSVAERHGGRLLSTTFKTGDVYAKVEWQNSDGQKFTARPFTVLRGGHWLNPLYTDYVWDFDRLSKKDGLYADYWYDWHDRGENNCYYFDENLNAKIR